MTKEAKWNRTREIIPNLSSVDSTFVIALGSAKTTACVRTTLVYSKCKLLLHKYIFVRPIKRQQIRSEDGNVGKLLFDLATVYDMLWFNGR